MSTAVEALIEQQMLKIGMSTYGLVEQLIDEYRDALQAFNERSAADAQVRDDFAALQATTATQAEKLVSLTQSDTALANVTQQFFRDRLANLEQRIETSGQADASLLQACRLLRQKFEEQPDDLAHYLDQYQRIAELLAVAYSARTQEAQLQTAFAEEIAALRAELDSPLFTSKDFAALKAQLNEKLDLVASMGVRQTSMASQGLQLLRQRIRRELYHQAEQRFQKQHHAAELRLLTHDMLAKLHAVARQTHLPEFSNKAYTMLHRFSELLGEWQDDDSAPIKLLSEDVTALFHACERALADEETALYVRDQVTEVLTSMGYEVTPLPAEGDKNLHRCLAPVEGSIGVEFHFDGTGHLGAQMVAFEDAALPDAAEAEEKVCALVDEVFDALRKRQCYIRERFRVTQESGAQIPVVHLPEAAPAVKQKAAKKPLRMDE